MADFPDALAPYIAVEHRAWYLKHWQQNRKEVKVNKIQELKRRSDELKHSMERAKWLEEQIEICQKWKQMMISGSPVSERHKMDYCLEVVGPAAWGKTPISINEMFDLLTKRNDRLQKELSEL